MIIAVKQIEKQTLLVAFDEQGAETKRVEWGTGRDLMETILVKLDEFIGEQTVEGFIVHKGPGSFTSLRIICSTINTLAWARGLPVIGIQDDEGLDVGLKRLTNGENDQLVMPHYGRSANITTPKK